MADSGDTEMEPSERQVEFVRGMSGLLARCMSALRDKAPRSERRRVRRDVEQFLVSKLTGGSQSPAGPTAMATEKGGETADQEGQKAAGLE